MIGKQLIGRPKPNGKGQRQNKLIFDGATLGSERDGDAQEALGEDVESNFRAYFPTEETVARSTGGKDVRRPLRRYSPSKCKKLMFSRMQVRFV
jgi:hypothetical protein